MLPGGFGGVKPGAKRAAEERERVIAAQGAPRAMEGPQRPIEGPQRPMEGPQRPMEGPQRPMEGPAPPPGPEPALDDDESDDDLDGDESDDDVDDFPHGQRGRDGGAQEDRELHGAGTHREPSPHRLPRLRRQDIRLQRHEARPATVPRDCARGRLPGARAVVVADGDQFLCVTGHPQPKIYDRDGRELGEFDKGDMYIRDLKNTKGHCSPCTGGAWHPYEKHTVLTSSADGSMRVWDVNYLGNPRGAQASVLKPALVKPGRVQVTACCYSPDGSVIAGAVSDGSIQIFPTGSRGFRSASVGLVMPPSAQCHFDNHWSFSSRPKTTVKKSHPPGETVTKVAFSRDGNTLLSRCQDGTLRVWDMRNASKVVKTFDDLETTHEETTVGFSPNDDFFFTGVDAPMSRADKGDGAPRGVFQVQARDGSWLAFQELRVRAVAPAPQPGVHRRRGPQERVHEGALRREKSPRGACWCAWGGKPGRSPSRTSSTSTCSPSRMCLTRCPCFRSPCPGRRRRGRASRRSARIR